MLFFRKKSEHRALFDKFQLHPEAVGIVSWDDFNLLRTLVTRYHSKRILDLGTGIGASAAALASATEGTIVSIENDEKCLRIAGELIPLELQKKIRFELRAPYAFAYPPISKYLYFSGYKDLPTDAGPFDFVLVDGPAYWIENGQYVGLPNGDIIPLLAHITPGGIVFVDGRKGTVRICTTYLSPYLAPIELNRHYSIFRRTERLAEEPLQVVHPNQKLLDKIFQRHHY